MQEIRPHRLPGLLLGALTPPGPLVLSIAVAAGLAGAFMDLSSASPSAADHATAVGLTWTVAVGLGGWLVSATVGAFTKTPSWLSETFRSKRGILGAISSIRDLATNTFLARRRRKLTNALNTALEALQADSSVGLAIERVDRIVEIRVTLTAVEKKRISLRRKDAGIEVSISQLDPETFVIVVSELAHSAVTYTSAIEDSLGAEPLLRDAWGWVVFRRLMNTDLPWEIGQTSSFPFDKAPADVQRATLSIEDILRTTTKRGKIGLDSFLELNMLRSKVAAATLAMVRQKEPR